MRALIVTNMYPTPERPALGSFVADQVRALIRTEEAEIDVFAFAPGGYRSYVGAARTLHRGLARRPLDPRHAPDRRHDIVHAHFGLTTWPALAAPARARLVTLHGTDLAHPRSRPVTLAGLPFNDVVGVVSQPLAREIPRWATGPGGARRIEVLPCGVDMHRFLPIDRAVARRELGLDPDGPCLLFPADPQRPEKRHDLALAVAGDTPLLTLGDVAPERVPLYVNAANAVLAPSDREGFGLGVLEALACDVPVLSTPHGVAPEALAGVTGALCAAFDAETWRTAVRPHVRAADPRIAGRPRAEGWSSDRMAARVIDVWRSVLARS